MMLPNIDNGYLLTWNGLHFEGDALFDLNGSVAIFTAQEQAMMGLSKNDPRCISK